MIKSLSLHSFLFGLVLLSTAAPSASALAAPEVSGGNSSKGEQVAMAPMAAGDEAPRDQTVAKPAKKPGAAKSAPSIWLVIPFILMLLAIAILPLTLEHFWESNLNKLIIALVLGVPIAIYFGVTGTVNQHYLTHTLFEYVAFMCLLGSLYVISGGILLKGDLTPSPTVNTGFLALGAVLASFMGTTGAAMLLIRPVISINTRRKHRVHTVIFFTFLVANIGGLLTPLGDPPLFMGYLRGVPFTWTFGLLPQWAALVGTLLGVYFIWDSILWKRDTEAQEAFRKATEREPLSLSGTVNFPLLAGVVLCVAFGAKFPILIGSSAAGFTVREVAMIGLAIVSWLATSKKVRSDNEFTFHPIIEVAALFLGIFLTMIPAVALLQVRGGDLGVTEPWQFFWATGALSSFLDNTPTYVVFFSLAGGDLSLFDSSLTSTLVAGVPEKILVAISLGAVFMGANTYIGNGPNFMVKAIADERGIRMPSFFGYMFYAFIILVPLFVVFTFVWF
ncbi:MAG: sodium:proton antiporter [Polyangia bacterium]|jgi:Na+/H+ antiporter NhaD/arsenite permease-like protein|nr:sodium:proton antiporter [Polyangia bacterium]